MTPNSPIKWIVICTLSLLASAFPASARSAPELTVQGPRGEQTPLAIASFETKVVLFEDLAETTITITFRNPTDKITEGEFAMGLPPGATVSGYALDVNGRMRESTVVEKERARFAYESIKRQMIDPGFVEREDGNTYRTKIFPIPAKGTKAVRLSYCEILDPNDGHLDYHLPLPITQIDTIRFEIEHIQKKSLTFPEGGKLKFAETRPGTHVAKLEQQSLPPELVIRLDQVAESTTITVGDYTYRRQPSRNGKIEIIPNGRTFIEIIWDCSRSGLQRDRAKEFAFLEDLFGDHPDLTVRLTFLRLDLTPEGEFLIKDGEWSGLKKALENAFYDGGTNLAAFQPNQNPTLFFTDGQAHFSSLSEAWPTPVILIDSTGSASPYWKSQALLSGGHYLDLTLPDPRSHSTVSRRKFGLKDENLTLDPDQETRHSNNASTERLITTLWAQQKLAQFESEFAPDSQKIILHCKEHHLVSDFTSLIVLDRFEDYLRYEIPPPEPELRKKYDDQVAKKKRKANERASISEIWNERKRWHSKFFPWQERSLVPAMNRLIIWKRSLLKTFELSELNPETLTRIEKLDKEARTLFEIRRKNPIKKGAEYEAWLTELEAISGRLLEIQNLSAGAIMKNQQMAIAVNGLVNQPGKIIAPSDLTLLAAIQKAGGIGRFGSGSRVSVYRSSRKITYNTLSEKFVDVPLQPGDFIVVETELSYDDWDGTSDPFSDASEPQEPVDHRKAPAIVNDFEEQTPLVGDGWGGGSDGGDSLHDPFGDPGTGSGKTQTSLALSDPATREDFASIIKALEEAKDNHGQLYLKLRKEFNYPDQFYLRAGDILLEKNMPDLANQVLSNLIEAPTAKPAAYRKWAYLLAKHGDWLNASDILERIAIFHPRDQAIALDQAWVASKLNRNEAVNLHLNRSIKAVDIQNRNSTTLAEIAVSELKRTDLPLDLRIVVSSASGQDLSLRLAEPTGSIAYFGKWRDTSTIGASSIEALGIGEYALKRAAPGAYRLGYRSRTTQVVRVHIYRDWGRPQQTCQEEVILLPATTSRQPLLGYHYKLE